MKYWLIIFFLNANGDFVGKREIAYKNEVECYQAMDAVHSRKKLNLQLVCVSDDHHAGRKQDPGVPYD